LKILVADDHPLFRVAIRGMVTSITADAEVEEAEDYNAAADRVGRTGFDLILLDLMMPGLDGLAGLVNLVGLSDGTPVVVITGQADPDSMRSVRLCGAAGFIDKRLPPDRMANAIGVVLNGGHYFVLDPTDEVAAATGTAHEPLTTKQVQVFNLLIQGKSNKEIANLLAISPNTVKVHITEILRKLSVTSRTQAIALARGPWPQP
jgi:DNA-binding NarL/FixJ family response regulator